jgi:hypothetical protein
MKLFSVEVQPNQVQWLIPQVAEADVWFYTVFECTSKLASWQRISWQLVDNTKPQANFYTLGSHGAFAFDEKVYNSELFPFLSQAGEILPICLSNKIIYALNILSCVGKLDSLSLYPAGLFKLTNTYRGQILTCCQNKESDFINVYNKLSLTGLCFREINSQTLARIE